MYFLSYPYRVLAALCSINVDFVVEIGWPGWCEEWDDYDLEVWELVRWMEKSFGPSFSGMSFFPLSFFHSLC
jgi:hypothetical protein